MFLKKEKLVNYGLILVLIVVGVSFRFLPHVPNFTPIIALTLFGAAYLPRKYALMIPLGIMLTSDFFIGSYQPGLMLVVYGSLLLITGLGFLLKNNDNWKTIGITSLLGAVLFFVITNFGVWLLTPWYGKSLAGLMKCYYLALPFFRNTMLSTLIYSGALFFVYKNAKVWLREKEFMLNFNCDDSRYN